MAKRLSVKERRRRRIREVRDKISWFEEQLKNLPSQIQRYRDELDELALAEKNDKQIVEVEPQTKLKDIALFLIFGVIVGASISFILEKTLPHLIPNQIIFLGSIIISLAGIPRVNAPRS